MSSPSKFPTFKLPKGPLELVLGLMGYRDIIELSQTSKSTRALIKSKAHLWKHTVVLVSFYGLMYKSVSLENSSGRLFEWGFHSDRHSIQSFPDNPQHRSYDGVAMDPFGIWEEHSYLCVGSEDHVLFWTQFLTDLFSTSIRRVSLKTNNCFFDFEKYFVKSSLLHKSYEFDIDDGGFSHEEMSFMLDNFKTHNFCCKGYPGKSFKPLNPISFEIIQLGNGIWVDPEILENLTRNSELIRIEHTILTSQQINQFIRKWLSEGADWKFRDISIRYKKYSLSHRGSLDPEELDKEQIFLGIDTIPGSKKSPAEGLEYLDSEADYENGVDIAHKDGFTATIHFFEQEYNIDFSMTIWK